MAQKRMQDPTKVHVGGSRYGWVCRVHANQTLRKKGPNAKVVIWTTEACNKRVGQVSLSVIRDQLGI